MEGGSESNYLKPLSTKFNDKPRMFPKDKLAKSEFRNRWMESVHTSAQNYVNFYASLPPSSWIFIHVLWKLQTVPCLSFLLKGVCPVQSLEKLVQGSTAYSVPFFLSFFLPFFISFFLSRFLSSLFKSVILVSWCVLFLSVLVTLLYFHSSFHSHPTGHIHSFVPSLLSPSALCIAPCLS